MVAELWIDPLEAARTLWLKNHPLPKRESVRELISSQLACGPTTHRPGIGRTRRLVVLAVYDRPAGCGLDRRRGVGEREHRAALQQPQQTPAVVTR